MRINAFPLAVFLSTAFLLASCSAITTSQKAVIQEFATSAKSYTDAPKALLTTYSDCLYKSAQMEAATSREDVMIGQLDRASDDYLKRVKFNEDFTTTYLLLNKYFQALVDFINVDSAKEFKTNVATLGTGLDSLISKSKNVKINTIPTGFGTIAGVLAQYIGKARIRKQQLKYFKDFIAKGDVLVERASLVLNEILVGTLLKGELEKGNRDLKGIYTLYLANLDSGDKKTGSFYKDLNPQYLEIKNCFGRGLLLLSKISDATTSFRAAHKELVTLLSTKDSKVVAKSIGGFTDEASQIDDLIKQFKPTN